MPAKMEFLHPPVFFRRAQKNSSEFFQLFMAFVANRIDRHKLFSQIHFYSALTQKPMVRIELTTYLPRTKSISRERDLNSRPTVYKTVALPLSYLGIFGAGLTQNSCSSGVFLVSLCSTSENPPRGSRIKQFIRFAPLGQLSYVGKFILSLTKEHY